MKYSILAFNSGSATSISRISPGMRPANERSYIVTTSLIGRVHTYLYWSLYFMGDDISSFISNAQQEFEFWNK